MKSYIRIQVPTTTLPANRVDRAAAPGVESYRPIRGRVPGPFGVDLINGPANSFLEEMITGGFVDLELDSKVHEWRISPPAFANWQSYLPSCHGRFNRGADEIILGDVVNENKYFSLRQANRMSGNADFVTTTERCPFRTEWKRIPKPLPESGQPPIWYGLAIAGSDGAAAGPRVASATVVSDNQWFTFMMPELTAGPSRGYFWSAAFVLLTGYLDRGDCIANPGAGADYELSLGPQWRERAGALNHISSFQFDDLIQFTLNNAETLRALGMAVLEETCIDYDEKHVIICDLAGAGINAGIYAYTGECVQHRS
jgi:hypothetical protein